MNTLEERIEVNETRISNIEIMILDDPDNLTTIKETCKGVFEGTANLQQEIALNKHEIGKLHSKLDKIIELLLKWMKPH